MGQEAKEFFVNFKNDVAKMKELILEAALVAVMMGGGPAYTHIPVVMDTLESLES
jgi:hypothetical protein